MFIFPKIAEFVQFTRKLILLKLSFEFKKKKSSTYKFCSYHPKIYEYNRNILNIVRAEYGQYG